MSNTQTVDVTATTVDTSAQAPQSNVTEAKPVASFDAMDTLIKVFQSSKGSSDKLNEQLLVLATSGDYTHTQLSQLLDAFNKLASSEELESISGLPEDKIKLTASLGRHYLAGALCRALDNRYNAVRVDLCSKSNGHGIYAEGGPLGHAGLGLGLVSKSTQDGRTTTKRSGVGVYLRSDHIMQEGAKRLAASVA